MIHHRTHPTPVDGCWNCKISSVGFSATAMPSRAPEVTATNALQKKWDKDIPAYKSLRKDGLQPVSSDGAHDLMMRAESAEQVESKPKLWAHRDDLLTGAPPERAA